MTEIVQTSRFLTLPGEIRKRICEYALTPELPKVLKQHTVILPIEADVVIALGEVTHKDRSIAVVRDLGTKKALNQLKTTCKQLAAETTDLEFQYNEIDAVVYCKKGWFEDRQWLTSSHTSTDLLRYAEAESERSVLLFCMGMGFGSVLVAYLQLSGLWYC